MSHDELPFQLTSVIGSPICAISPANADIFVKTIMRMGLKSVKIQNSIACDQIQTNGRKGSYSIISADLSITIGKNVNLNFELSKDKKRLLKQLKGNHTLLFYDHNDKYYFVTNGDSSFLIEKLYITKSIIGLPRLEDSSIRRIITDKASQIKNIMGSAKYVDLLIYEDCIATVCVPCLTNINFQPLATADYIRRLPDLRLRAYHFLYICASEVQLTIAKSDYSFWLRTSIDITDSQKIFQFERLTVV
jgi:hypothetical protein